MVLRTEVKLSGPLTDSNNSVETYMNWSNRHGLAKCIRKLFPLLNHYM
jgi:hypothetical protein